MTTPLNITELRELAERHKSSCQVSDKIAFHEAANPSAVLQLIERVEKAEDRNAELIAKWSQDLVDDAAKIDLLQAQLQVAKEALESVNKTINTSQNCSNGNEYIALIVMDVLNSISPIPAVHEDVIAGTKGFEKPT